MRVTRSYLLLSIVVINYKTDDLILDLLKSLSPDKALEIIIVDNSPENTIENRLPQRKDLKYIYANKNLGFSGGNNLGISIAKGEWLLLLNSDILVDTKTILKWLESVNLSGYKASAPQLIGGDGKTQNNVGYFDSVVKNPTNFIFARPRFINASKVSKPTEVDLMTGAAMLIHKSVFNKVGLLDDKNFFMYFEDIDFSYRLHRAGLKILYVPEIEITHFGGASSDQDSRQKNKNYQYGLGVYLRKNRGIIVYYLNKIFGFLK